MIFLLMQKIIKLMLRTRKVVKKVDLKCQFLCRKNKVIINRLRLQSMEILFKCVKNKVNKRTKMDHFRLLRKKIYRVQFLRKKI